MARLKLIVFIVQVLLLVVFCELPNEQRLHHFLLVEKGYNKLVLPKGDKLVLDSDGKNKSVLTVKLGLRLVQILVLEEKSQILKSNVWLRHEWTDRRMSWDPEDFGGINYTQFPSEMLWRPDIVLYNNADGEFTITLFTKATVYSTGKIIWEPPALYKSYCPINVEFFPFDQQECFMKFGSWTYDGYEVDLKHVHQEKQGLKVGNFTIVRFGIDLCDYYQNVEWDIINVTARRKEKFYPCCGDVPFPDITFNITMRRKTLFYTINLILPIIAISGLTVLVFYLPSESGEKITLSISILLALTVFFLLLSDINPPTSLTIPLIGKYLLFTMIVVTMSIFLTVYTLSIHFRSPSTHTMSPWTKSVFTEILPKILCMKRPQLERKPVLQETPSLPEIEMAEMTQIPTGNGQSPNYENLRNRHVPSTLDKYPVEVRESIKGVKFIAEHMKKDAEEQEIERDWNYVAMVMDRLFLFVFTTACICGTLGIFLNAPSLYDPRGPLTSDNLNCSRK